MILFVVNSHQFVALFKRFKIKLGGIGKEAHRIASLGGGGGAFVAVLSLKISINLCTATKDKSIF